MSSQSQNPLLNKLPTDRNTMEVGFLIVLLAIILFLSLGFVVLHFGVPVIEDMLAEYSFSL